MTPLKSSHLEFLKTYGYKVKQTNERCDIRNSNYTSNWVNVLLIIVGLLGIPIAVGGSYKIGLLFLLLLTIPVLRIINRTPKTVSFDYLNNLIDGEPLSLFTAFQFETSENFAYATPFETGTTEYAVSLILHKTSGEKKALMRFVDREEEKQGAQDLLDHLNNWFTQPSQ